jgi:threonine aldolase
MNPIELYVARQLAEPDSVFTSLASHANHMGIEAFDVYGDFSATSSTSWLRGFESTVAQHFGMEDALFLPSGVMAQMIMLMIYSENSNNLGQGSFLCHYSSHILIHENNSYSDLLKLKALVINPKENEEIQYPLTFMDVSSLITSLQPATVVIECPHRELGGKCTSLEDIRAISALCRSSNTRFHMDGARIWEASAFYNDIDLKEFCSYFDSIYVSFYKGLGGLTGAMLLGKQDFIAQSRIWLRRFGGNLFTLSPYAISAAVGFQENKDSFVARKDRLRHVVAIITR